MQIIVNKILRNDHSFIEAFIEVVNTHTHTWNDLSIGSAYAHYIQQHCADSAVKTVEAKIALKQ